MNSVHLIGRIGHDIEVKQTSSGVAVCSVRLAVERQQSEDSRAAGEAKVTDWLDITIWRGRASFLGKYARKGARLAVDGRIQARTYEDADGKQRRAVEIVADDVTLIDWPDKGAGSAG